LRKPGVLLHHLVLDDKRMALERRSTRVATGPFGIGPDGPMPPVLDLVTALPSRTDGVFSWLVPGYLGDLPEDVDNEEIRLTYLAGLLWVIETYKLRPVGPPR
jgi:hypothetical protein